MTDLEKEIREASIDYQMENYPMAIGGATFEDAVRDLNVSPAFISGAEWMKERMMRDVVEYTISPNMYLCIPRSRQKKLILAPGDKIKILILKEDEKAD